MRNSRSDPPLVASDGSESVVTRQVVVVVKSRYGWGRRRGTRKWAIRRMDRCIASQAPNPRFVQRAKGLVPRHVACLRRRPMDDPHLQSSISPGPSARSFRAMAYAHAKPEGRWDAQRGLLRGNQWAATAHHGGRWL